MTPLELPIKFRDAYEKARINGKTHRQALRNQDRRENMGSKSYPAVTSRAWRVSDNAALWVNGKIELASIVKETGRGFDARIQAVQDKIQRVHTKTNRGIKYFYEWNTTTQKYDYCGRKDPSPGYSKQIEKIRAERKARIDEMMSCVVEAVNNHYIVDFRRIKFKTYSGSQFLRLADLIKLSKNTWIRSSASGQHK